MGLLFLQPTETGLGDDPITGRIKRPLGVGGKVFNMAISLPQRGNDHGCQSQMSLFSALVGFGQILETLQIFVFLIFKKEKY